MNPKEFDWDDSQQVTVTNPTAKNFKFKVYNKEYEVKSGQTVKMPGYHAMLFVHGLAMVMSQDDNVFSSMIDEEFRQSYYNKLIVGRDEMMQTIEPEQFDDHNEETEESEVKTPVKRGRRPKSQVDSTE